MKKRYPALLLVLGLAIFPVLIVHAIKPLLTVAVQYQAVDGGRFQAGCQDMQPCEFVDNSTKQLMYTDGTAAATNCCGGGGGGGTVTSVDCQAGLTCTPDPIVGSGTIAIDSTVATLTGAQALTNKTLTAPVINGATSASGNFDLSGSSGTWKPPTGGLAAALIPNADGTIDLGAASTGRWARLYTTEIDSGGTSDLLFQTNNFDRLLLGRSSSSVFTSNVPNSGSNVGIILDNFTGLSGSTLLLSVRNATAEKFNITNGGVVNASSYFTTPSGGSGGLFDTAGSFGLEVGLSGVYGVAVYGGGIVPINSLNAPNGDGTHFWTAVYARHIETGQSAVPSCSGGAALGTGGSPGCACTGTDTSMECSFTTGTSGQTTGTMGTITFNTAFDATPNCVLTMSTTASQAGIGWATSVVKGSSSATQIVVRTGIAPGAGGTVYPTQIHCIH